MMIGRDNYMLSMNAAERSQSTRMRLSLKANAIRLTIGRLRPFLIPINTFTIFKASNILIPIRSQSATNRDREYALVVDRMSVEHYLTAVVVVSI